MPEAHDHEAFIRQLTEHQTRIYAYIFSLLGNHDRAADVLQETNIVLLRKYAEVQPGERFLFWAFSVSKFQVLAHLRDRKRDRLLLDPELIELVSKEVELIAVTLPEQQQALRGCLTKLSEVNQELVRRRYFADESIDVIASAMDRSQSAVKVALLRVRRHLQECITATMMAKGWTDVDA